MADDPLHSGAPLDYDPPEKDSSNNSNNIRAYQRNIAVGLLLYITINGKLTEDWFYSSNSAFLTSLGILLLTLAFSGLGLLIGRPFRREHRWAIAFTQVLILGVCYLLYLLGNMWG